MSTPARGHSHSHSHSANGPPPAHSANKAMYRSSVDTSNPPPSAGAAGRSWPRTPSGVRPASEMLNPNSAAAYAGNGGLGAGLQGGNPAAAFASSPETIDRWFEDLQHYESTLEEMAAASLDANFKEELSAIEQWFRVLSEAERTAALYSLLQSSTQVQMRFFITVLQQMARNDPMWALLSPANPGQVSMESQMDSKLHSMGLKAPSPSNSASSSVPSPSSPAPSARQFSRQSLGAPSTNHKANARISAPANLLGKPSGTAAGNWREEETLLEGGSDGRRSTSPGMAGRPKSTSAVQESYPSSAHVGQHLSQSTGPASTASFANGSSAGASKDDDLSSQLSPVVGGNWASMVSTPVIPMFAKVKKEGEENGDGGDASGESGNDSRDDGEAVVASSASGSEKKDGFVLDDVRKFRRSARISSGGNGIDGGALNGMYEQAAAAQQQQQRRAVSGGGSQLNSAQQNAINLGLNGLQAQYAGAPASPNPNNSNNNGATSPNLIAAQHAAVAAQANWRNGLSSPGLVVPSMSQLSNAALNNTGGNSFNPNHLTPTPLSFGFPNSFSNLSSPNGAQSFGGNSQSNNNNSPLSANAQLANLFALQQQMMQQQQLQQLAAMSLTPVQMMGFQQQQQSLLSPGGRGMGMGMGAFGLQGGAFGMGGVGQMNGLASPRRSPRPSDRSPGGNSAHSTSSKTNLPSTTGSGTNPDEDLDMTLIKDIPAWLRSLRLHKYTKEFEGVEWKEMVMMDEKKLEDRGVNALGARRKLLKVFETVRAKSGLALPGDGTSTTIAAGGSTTTSSSPDSNNDDTARMPDATMHAPAAAGSV